MSAIENFLAVFRRNNVPIAREALGITVSPANQAYDAVASALKIVQLPDGAIATALEVTATPKTTDDGIPWAGPTIAEMIDTGMLSKLQPVTPAELSPEYHAGLASRMIERLDADASRLADAIAAERKQHKLTMTALYAELAGLKRVRRAYKVAGAVLQPVERVTAGERIGLASEIIQQAKDPNSEWRKAHPNAIVSGGEKLTRDEISRLPLSPEDMEKALAEFDIEQMTAPTIKRRRKPAARVDTVDI